MNKIIKTWEERAKDAVASGKFAGFPHDYMPAEISELRAYIAELEERLADFHLYSAELEKSIAELESRPAAPVVAEGLRKAMTDVTDVLDMFGNLSDDQIDPKAWNASKAEEKIKAARAALAAHPVAGSPAECTNSDSWNCKYCPKTETCEALIDSRNFGTPAAAAPMPASEAQTEPKPIDNEKLATLVAWFIGGKLPEDLVWNTQITAEVIRRALVVAAPVPASEAASVRYTCIGKGGDYELIGHARAAGVLRDSLTTSDLTAYRDIASGMMFVRTASDFAERMESLAAPAAPTDDDLLAFFNERDFYPENLGDPSRFYAAVRELIGQRNSAQSVRDAAGEIVAWCEKDGDEWIVYDANSDIGRHILNHQKDRHGVDVFAIRALIQSPQAPGKEA